MTRRIADGTTFAKLSTVKITACSREKEGRPSNECSTCGLVQRSWEISTNATRVSLSKTATARTILRHHQMRGKKTANPDSVAAKSSTRKAPAKRGRSPEPTPSVDSDVAQPKSKRSKQVKASASKKDTAKSSSKVGATTQPVATEASPIVQVDEGHQPPPIYTGNFDLYAMDLPFLSKVFLPKGVSTPQYEALYQTILTYQADNDNTAQFFLASPADADDASTLISRAIIDPMEEAPLDISIRSIKHHVSLSLPTEPPSVALVGPAPDSPGVSGSTTLEEIHCGIQSASGVFKLKRVWTKATSGGDFVELFAGHFSFNITYGAMYKRKGHGTGQKHNWAFWAVRARTGDDGKEVGPRPMLPVSLHANTETPPTHPLAATAGEGGKAKQLFGAPKFSGNFSLYSMCDLIEEGHLPEAPFPSPEDVYKAIADADPKVTAKCCLGAPVSSYHDEADSKGRFRGTGICDPFVEQPYNVIITSTQEEESLSFTEDELGQFPTRDTDLSGPGITAQVTLSESDHPGVVAASGYIKFVRVWAKMGEKGELLEVFEAYLDLDISFEMSFKLGGRRFRPDPPRETHAVAFWAIRAGKDKDSGDWFSEEESDLD